MQRGAIGHEAVNLRWLQKLIDKQSRIARERRSGVLLSHPGAIASFAEKEELSFARMFNWRSRNRYLMPPVLPPHKHAGAD